MMTGQKRDGRHVAQLSYPDWRRAKKTPKMRVNASARSANGGESDVACTQQPTADYDGPSPGRKSAERERPRSRSLFLEINPSSGAEVAGWLPTGAWASPAGGMLTGGTAKTMGSASAGRGGMGASAEAAPDLGGTA